MVEIKAGRELDRAVAEAIGNTGSPHPEGYMGPSLPVPFLPSTDLNAAFDAAEKVGLFSETFWRTLGMDEIGEKWCVFEQDGCTKKAITVEYATPSLAICAAILRLKGHE